jgi:hypothetical protein
MASEKPGRGRLRNLRLWGGCGSIIQTVLCGFEKVIYLFGEFDQLLRILLVCGRFAQFFPAAKKLESTGRVRYRTKPATKTQSGRLRRIQADPYSIR